MNLNELWTLEPQLSKRTHYTTVGWNKKKVSSSSHYFREMKPALGASTTHRSSSLYLSWSLRYRGSPTLNTLLTKQLVTILHMLSTRISYAGSWNEDTWSMCLREKINLITALWILIMCPLDNLVCKGWKHQGPHEVHSKISWKLRFNFAKCSQFPIYVENCRNDSVRKRDIISVVYNNKRVDSIANRPFLAITGDFYSRLLNPETECVVQYAWKHTCQHSIQGTFMTDLWKVSMSLL